MTLRLAAATLGLSFIFACAGSPPVPCTTCGTECVSVDTDVRNCGSCGKACAAGELCKAGVCAATCGAGLSVCSGKCADLKHSPTNCGVCGTACATGEYCAEGTCAPAAACLSTQTSCSGACVNPQTDNANCGSCGKVCATGQSCTAGSCVTACTAGATACQVDAGSVCVNAQTDNANCGSCGHSCPSGQVCSAGSCSTSCGPGTTTCQVDAGSICANTQTDNANCGSCGVPCGAAQACLNGSCQVTCAANETNCQGQCFNLQTDDSHCGACANVCGSTSKCLAATCVDAFAIPRLCSQLPADAGIPRDGGFSRQTVYGFGRADVPLTVRCGVDGGTWLEVPADAGQNFARRAAGGFFTVGPEVVTRYQAVRIDYRFPNNLIIGPLDDLTFATTTGSQTQGNSSNSSTYTINFMSYGQASACVGTNNPAGTANITLTGIPLAVFNTGWGGGGFMTAGGATLSSFGQVVNVTGGGFCGDIFPSEGIVRVTACPAPGPEVCDKLDNNCDGVIDNLGDGGVCP